VQPSLPHFERGLALTRKSIEPSSPTFIADLLDGYAHAFRETGDAVRAQEVANLDQQRYPQAAAYFERFLADVVLPLKASARS
jgi:hypothetical protein